MRNLVAVIVISMLLLYGCSSSGSTSGKSGAAPQVNYRSGTQGITMSFLASNPADRTFDGGPLPITLDVRNLGAEDLGTSANIYLSGFDEKIISGVPKSQPIGALVGKMNLLSQTEGERTQVSFDSSSSIQLSKFNIDSYPVPLRATACYTYSTVANVLVCVDPDPTSIKREKVCTAQDVSFSGGQGAPVAVTSVGISSAKGRTTFTINIQNAGGGTVFKLGSIDKCDPYSTTAPSFNDFDQVQVDSVQVGNRNLDCKTKDRSVRLTNNAGFLFCTLDTTGQQLSFQSPLSVKLSYGYRTTITKQITIVRSPGSTSPQSAADTAQRVADTGANTMGGTSPNNDR